MKFRASMVGLLALASTAAIAQSTTESGERWYATIQAIAGDDTEGRLTGTPGYDKAAAYVADEFRKLGLTPAGDDGYYQQVPITEQFFNTGQTKMRVIAGGKTLPLAVPHDLFVRIRSEAPAKIDAPMVFAGYGMSIPSIGRDDFKGLAVKGKVVVVCDGEAPGIRAELKAAAQSERPGILAAQGAVGLIILNTPNRLDFPWPRQEIVSASPTMYLTDPKLRDQHEPLMIAFTNPVASQTFFEGSKYKYADLAQKCEASQPLPLFALPGRLQSEIRQEKRSFLSPNIVAKIQGTDPKLADEAIVMTSHLDAHGIGFPIDGDKIYNGVSDNASGVASVMEIARKLVEQGAKPKRTIVFAIVTAEEKGHMGSRYLVQKPTAAMGRIVANVNVDNPGAQIPFTKVNAPGAEDNTMGADVSRIAAEMGLPVVPEAHPERSGFRRSDQYSFIRKGIPAIVLKFGALRDSNEDKTIAAWRKANYHSPSDDFHWPLLKPDAARFNDYVAKVTLSIADNPVTPAWKKGNFFATFKTN